MRSFVVLMARCFGGFCSGIALCKNIQWSRAGISKLFSVKGQIVSILGFVGI